MPESPDDIVNSYMQQVASHSKKFPEAERAEIMSFVYGHFAEARGDGLVNDAASAHRVAARLGDPASLVASWVPSSVKAGKPAAPRGVPVVALTAGSLMFSVGWIVGIVEVWRSSRINIREKLVLTLVFPLGPFGALLLVNRLLDVTAVTCETSTFGRVESIGGTPIGEAVSSVACSHAGMSPALGFLLAIAALSASILVPLLIWSRVRARGNGAYGEGVPSLRRPFKKYGSLEALP